MADKEKLFHAFVDGRGHHNEIKINNHPLPLVSETDDQKNVYWMYWKAQVQAGKNDDLHRA